jgi:hypothetical protein
MIRPGAAESGLFLTPFVIFAAFALTGRAGPWHPQAWSLSRPAGLIIAWLLHTATSFFVPVPLRRVSPRSTSVPAPIEGGKCVPQSPQ